MIQPISSKILIIFPLILEISVSQNHEYHESLLHRNGWPIRHGSQSHNRHNHNGQWGRFHDTATQKNFQETTRNPIIQEVIRRDFKDIEPPEKSTRHHVGQRLLDETEQRPIRTDKLSAVTVNEYSGSRAAYIGFHNNYHHQRETNPPVYLQFATTPSTYTKHHPG